MTILIINNYYKEKNLSRANKITEALLRVGWDNYEMLSFKDIDEKKILDNFKAIILSGSAASFTDPKNEPDYSVEIEIVKKNEIPLLGICFGHQLIGKAFGSKLRSLENCVKDFKNVEVLEPNEIFASWCKGAKIMLSQYHKDYLTSLPKDFVLLARSDSCKIEAMKHKTRPIYGVQAHIERADDKHPEGRQILENFLSNVVGY